jgi:hypothetical protein
MLRIASLRAIFHSPSLSDRAAVEVRVFPPQIAATEFREKPCLDGSKTPVSAGCGGQCRNQTIVRIKLAKGHNFFRSFGLRPYEGRSIVLSPARKSRVVTCFA